MIVSAIIQLQAEQNGRIEGGTGRAIHGFWYEQWQNTQPSLGDQLHANRNIQPFTLSPLMGLSRPQRGSLHIKAGAQAWFRITCIDPDLSRPFLGEWLPFLPSAILLAGLPWQIKSISLMSQEHPAAKQTTYQQLWENATAQMRWELHFKTSTTFHMGKNAYLPFPLPGALYNSWRRRWDAFSPVTLPDIDKHILHDQLWVTQYNLKTVPVRYGRRVTMGCVGTMTLKAGKLPTEILKTITALTQFSTFCGSGRYTTQGMGQTQPGTKNNQQSTVNRQQSTAKS